LISCLCLLLFITKSNAQEMARNDQYYIRTNLTALAFTSEASLFFETRNIKKRRGLEIGISYHSPDNLVMVVTTLFGTSYTTTYGGVYETDSVSLLYKLGHRGPTLSANYRYYINNFKYYI
jgi:hypothetical protein